MNLFDIIIKKNKKNTVVVYTAIFGDYDDLKEPPEELTKNCDFICFTDNKKLKSKYYQIIYCKKENLSNHLQSRVYKIFPYKYLPKKYKYSIWIDGSIELKNFDVNNLIEKYLAEFKWASFIHPERDCIYDEAVACVSLGKDEESIIKKQVKEYELLGYPQKNGLVANGFILREHNDEEVIKICEKWWDEIIKKSKRDQLSFCFVAWREGFRFGIINENLWDNKYFKVLKHIKKII